MATTTPDPIQKAFDSTKTCRSLFADILLLRTGNQYIPPIYKQHYFVLCLVELSLAKTVDFVHHEGSDEDVEMAKKLSSVVGPIDHNVSELSKIAEHVKSTLKQSKWKAAFSSGGIPWHEIKVRTLGDSLMTCQVLLLRAGAPPLTSLEIEEVVQKTGISMDWRVQEHITDLKAYQRGSISGPAGVPHGMAELTPTESTVRRPSTFYNVYDARIIGTLNTDAGPVPQVIEGVTPKALTKAEAVLQRTISRPGPAALQFESPHLGGLVLTTSVPEINLSVPEGDASRSGSINTSQLPPPANPTEALERCLRELRNAKLDINAYPAVSLQVYRKAQRILNAISESGDQITDSVLFTKSHYATIIELGLSRIENPPAIHLGKALKHWERSNALATKLAQPRITARATLDKAQIRARTAQVQERSAISSKGTLRSIQVEAYTLYASAVKSMQDSCENMNDYHVLAESLLGCGREVRNMGISVAASKPKRFSFSSGGKDTVQPARSAQDYLLDAISTVEEGIALGEAENESEEALEEFAMLSQDATQLLRWLPKAD